MAKHLTLVNRLGIVEDAGSFSNFDAIAPSPFLSLIHFQLIAVTIFTDCESHYVIINFKRADEMEMRFSFGHTVEGNLKTVAVSGIISLHLTSSNFETFKVH